MSVKVTVTGSGTQNVTGADYSALKAPLSIAKNVGPFSTSNANSAALGADETVSFIQTVTASGSVDVDLTNLTDLLQRSSTSFARDKAFVIRLLSQTDDSTNGTPCTGITINGAGTNLAVLPGITGLTLGNGDVKVWATPNASGTAVSGTTKIVHIVNNDSSHVAAVQLTFIGGTT